MAFRGIIPALTTPFTARDTVDIEGLHRNARHLVEAGVTGLVVNGTMGEASSLSVDERRAVVEVAVAAAAGAVPVVVGVSASTPRSAADHAQAAEAGGAQGLMLLPPLLYAADLRELVAFFAQVADATSLPLMLYNNPAASGLDLSPDDIRDVVAVTPAVIAVKECSGDARRIAALVSALPQVDVLVGGDDWALEGLAAGATGWVSGVADVVPRHCVLLLDHVQAGDLAAARAVYSRLLPLARFDMTPKLVQYFKAALDEAGLAGGPSRPPRLGLTTAEQRALEAAYSLVKGDEPTRT